MSQLTASQIAEMAAEFEGLDARFYGQVAKVCSDESASRLFEFLSGFGLKHQQLFGEMAAQSEWKAAIHEGFIEVRAHFKFLIEGLRKNIFRFDNNRPLTLEACFSAGIFAEEKSVELYTEMCKRAPDALRESLLLVIDDKKEQLKLLGEVWAAYYKTIKK